MRGLGGAELFTTHETACAYHLCVSLPRRASVVTGWSPLQMGPLLPMAGKLSSEPGINLDRVEARWFEYEKVAR